MFVALYSTSLPFDCRSLCRQILNEKFIVETNPAPRLHLSGERTRPRVRISAPRRNSLLVLEGRSARAPIAARETRALPGIWLAHAPSFVTALAQMHGFKVQRFAMQRRAKDVSVSLKFPPEYSGEIFVITLGFAIGSLVFFPEVSAA